MAWKTPTVGLDTHTAYVKNAGFLQTLALPFVNRIVGDRLSVPPECSDITYPATVEACQIPLSNALVATPETR